MAKPVNPPARKPFLIIVIVIIAAGLVAAVIWGGWMVYRKHQQSKVPDYSALSAEAIELQNAARPLENNDLAGALANIDAIIAQTPETEKKVNLYMARSNLCATEKDYECAIASNNQILLLDPQNINALVMNGGYEYDLGRKEPGNAFYERAIVVLKDSPLPRDQETAAKLETIVTTGTPIGVERQ